MSHKSECFPYFACSVRDIVWILYPIYMQYLRRYFDKNVLYYRILKLFLGWHYVCHFNNSINASVHTHKTHILTIQFGFPGLDIFSTNMLWYSAFAQYPWLSTSLNQGVLVCSVGVLRSVCKHLWYSQWYRENVIIIQRKNNNKVS